MRQDNPRRAIEALKDFQCGDPFRIQRIAQVAGISIEAAQSVLDDMLAEGVIAERPMREGQGSAHSATMYYRISPASKLLRMPWNRTVDLGRAIA